MSKLYCKMKRSYHVRGVKNKARNINIKKRTGRTAPYFSHQLERYTKLL